jgi:protein-disulfide isomerase
MPTFRSSRTLLSLCFLTLSLAAVLPTAAFAEPLATVDGKPILRATVTEAVAAESAQIEREAAQRQYDLLQAKLAELVEQRLLEAEAAAKGTTAEQLLASIPPVEVTDAEIDAFYLENKERIPKPKEEIAGQIRQYLEQSGQTQARQRFFAELRARHAVEILLEPLRIEVAAVGPARGPAGAPVTIVEFSDFQCPFCARLIPTVEQVLAKYGDKVRLVFRQFPLTFHAHARKAAEASLCAHEQDGFWALHDAMFQNQAQLAEAELKTKAAALGMNAEAFAACLDSGKYAGQVDEDLAAGGAAGVSGTPALFINGRFISGAVPLEDITSVVDDELRRKAR